MKSTELASHESLYLKGFFLVFFAGLLWSFGAPTVRYMIDG